MTARWRFGAGTIAVSVGVTLVALLSTAAPTEGAGPPVATYMGDEVCSACHGDLIPAWRATLHSKAFAHPYAHEDVMSRGCEGCHGPGSLHVEAGGGRGIGGLVTFASDDEPTVRSENAVCLECHSGGRRLYWEGSPHHSSDVSCASCHRIMESTAEDVDTCARCHTLQNAQRFRNAHMPLREGRMSCSSCHNVHGTITESLIPQHTINDNCYGCHAEKRGPFLWEHPPVMESCLNCHLPHGSTRPSMLRDSPPRLCQECHAAGHPSNPRDPTSKFVLGGSCLNCHPQIHGTNHPSGMRLTR